MVPREEGASEVNRRASRRQTLHWIAVRPIEMGHNGTTMDSARMVDPSASTVDVTEIFDAIATVRSALLEESSHPRIVDIALEALQRIAGACPVAIAFDQSERLLSCRHLDHEARTAILARDTTRFRLVPIHSRQGTIGQVAIGNQRLGVGDEPDGGIRQMAVQAIADLLALDPHWRRDPSVQAADEASVDELLNAMRAGELTGHYQPIIDIATGRTVGAETLCRWDHPGRGLLTPATFIDLAEENGLIGVLGLEMLRQGADTARRAQEIDPAFRVSVNVSPRQIAHPDQFLDEVREVLRLSPLAPGSLVLELTETSLVEVGSASSLFDELNALGVTIAIDDFGTGYSALSYLDDLPVEYLKIDRSFVNRMGTGVQGRATIKALVDLAARRSMTVIAEGVEERSQHAHLRAMRVDYGQGWLWSPAVPSEELLHLVHAQQLV